MGARHSHGGLVGRDPADEVTEVPDQALVDSALRDLLGSVLVHQLAGQHHAAVRAGRSAEGVHVDADERAVGTERRAGGDADDESVSSLETISSGAPARTAWRPRSRNALLIVTS